MVSANVSSYIIGACFGIIVVTVILFAFVRGWTASSGITSHRILYFIALSDCVYSQVKMVQLNSERGKDCIVAENLSLIFYHGSNTLQLIFYILRYREIFQGFWSLMFPSIATLLYASAIPIAAVFNHPNIDPSGVCTVIHPAVSAYLPLATNFLASVYMLALFLFPFLKPLFKREGLKLRQIAAVSCNLFITNSIAIIFNIFFNFSLTTSLNIYAPLLSMIDLTVNFTMVCSPYFLSRLHRSCSEQHSDFRSTFVSDPPLANTQSLVTNSSEVAFPSSSYQREGNLFVTNESLPNVSRDNYSSKTCFV
ncbi:hypothetical protein K7432_012867 [Basidiobolus ranarum]|uniref:Uncharacterized protein n=1 Tax=Basidiobolus ranarum TaxID=34480 RepID=A0ABR2WK47_9FUNG